MSLAEILDQEIKAIWWKQPFCSLMLKGKVETRTWDTQYRGWVLMVCSQDGYNFKKLRETCGLHQMARIRDVNGPDGTFHLNEMAIALGRLAHVQKMHPDDEDATFVKFNEKLFCHVYEDVIAIEPFKPWPVGVVGFKTLDDRVKDMIKLL